jgi:hypothetical protein
MRGIASTRAPATLDLDDTVAAALREFDDFIETWIGTAAHEVAYNSPACDRVRDAILAVAKTAHRDRAIGLAVFKVSYSAANSSRLEYECMTPVFEEANQPANALAGYRARREGHYEILAVVEPL